MRTLPVLTLALVVSVASSRAAVAQQTTIDMKSRTKRIIDSLVSIVRTRYVDADTGAMVAAGVLDRFKQGAYDDAQSLDALARALTSDLRRVNGDLHLTVAPSSALGGFAPPGSGAGRSSSAPGAPLSAVDSVRVLRGNVGYVAIGRFAPPTLTALDDIATAMAKLEHVDALIVDLRGNRGGVAAMVDTLWTYFVAGNDTVHTLKFRGRGEPLTQRWVIPSKRLRPRPTIPLFILTGITGSAAEGFTYFLQKSGRAIVVGERTGGAGNMAAPFPLGDDLVAVVSIRRVWYGDDVRGWERIGVLPDIGTPAASALDSAYALALRRLNRPSS
jgi:hypothetical protein